LIAPPELYSLSLHDALPIWVERRRDERPRPVDGRAKSLQVLHRRRREDVDPVHRIRELRDLAVGDAHGPEDLPLLRLFLRDPLCRSEDREAGAMERLRMEDIVAEHPSEARLELRAQEGGTEAQVLVPVHVRIRHVGVPFRAAGVRARDIYLLPLPHGLPLRLDPPQVARFRDAPGLRRQAGEGVRPRFLTPDRGATGLGRGPWSR